LPPSRPRDRRRRRAAVIRNTPNPNATERASVAHGQRRGVTFSWRVVSGAIVLTMLSLLSLFWRADAFYVHTIAVGGLQTLSKEDVFALSEVADYHVFWVEPAQVRENLIESPTIADARVTVGWVPPMVRILVEEREPALVWEQAGTAVWIDIHGRVMVLTEDRDNLLRVTYDGLASAPLQPQDSVPQEVVQGALQLQTLLAGQPLRYRTDYGLGIWDERGWDAWFGVGTDMPNRLAIYNALVSDLMARNIQPDVISVADPDAVYYATLFGR
jgi:cell division septal protein FtsQ